MRSSLCGKTFSTGKAHFEHGQSCEKCQEISRKKFDSIAGITEQEEVVQLAAENSGQKEQTKMSDYIVVVDGVGTNYGSGPEGFHRSIMAANIACIPADGGHHATSEVVWLEGEEVITHTKPGMMVRGPK